MPVYLMPGNHDDPAIMREFFGDTPMFPGQGPHYQYAIEGPDFRTLMLNSHFDDSELPYFGPRRLQWLEDELEKIRPAHADRNPPPADGDRGRVSSTWSASNGTRALRDVLTRHPQVLKVICGHGHLDLNGHDRQHPGADGRQLLPTS